MKWHVTIFICLSVICGCERRQPSADEKSRDASHKMMCALRTNATIRTIRSSSEIRNLLAEIKEQDEKSKVISEWQTSLFGVTIQGQSPSNQYGAIREASSVLDWDVACAMRECGYSLEKSAGTVPGKFFGFWAQHRRVCSGEKASYDQGTDCGVISTVAQTGKFDWKGIMYFIILVAFYKFLENFLFG